MPSLEYLSARWFLAVADSIADGGPVAAAGRHRFLSVDPSGSTISHAMAFDSGGRMVEWARSTDEDGLICARPRDLEQRALLDWVVEPANRQDAVRHFVSTSLTSSSGRQSSGIGIDLEHGLRSLELGADSFDLCFELEVPSMLGSLRAAARFVSRGGVVSLDRQITEPDVAITCSYEQILDLLQDRVSLGAIMTEGGEVRGNIVAVSAIDALLSGDKIGVTGVLDALALRRLNAALALNAEPLTVIRSFTAAPGA